MRKLTALRPGALARLWRDRSGAAAIEFAMVVPVLLCMYFLSNEVGQGVETGRKLSRAAATIGLVATQQTGTVTVSELEGMMALGGAALQPYNRGSSTFTVTGVKVDNDAKAAAKVVWSRSFVTDPKDTTGKGGTGAAGRTKASVVQIPAAMQTPGSFLVMVEAGLDYKPIIAWASTDGKSLGMTGVLWPIKMSEKSYQVTRDLNLDIACTDC